MLVVRPPFIAGSNGIEPKHGRRTNISMKYSTSFRDILLTNEVDSIDAADYANQNYDSILCIYLHCAANKRGCHLPFFVANVTAIL